MTTLQNSVTSALVRGAAHVYHACQTVTRHVANDVLAGSAGETPRGGEGALGQVDMRLESPVKLRHSLTMTEELVSLDSVADLNRESSLFRCNSLPPGALSFTPQPPELAAAQRLAHRLYHLKGFNLADVGRQLSKGADSSKNSEFSLLVGSKVFSHFNFQHMSLAEALRLLLQHVQLPVETAGRNRILTLFAKRYSVCNPAISEDGVLLIARSVLQLNAQLHDSLDNAVTFNEFANHLSEQKGGSEVPREVLRQVFGSVRQQRLDGCHSAPSSKGFPSLADGEYKSGSVLRKCCTEAEGTRTPLGRRAWKMYYAVVQGLTLCLFADSSRLDTPIQSLTLLHALACVPDDYSKKQFVFRLRTASRCEFLFQVSCAADRDDWVDVINLLAASLSPPPLDTPLLFYNRHYPVVTPTNKTVRQQFEWVRDHLTELKKDLERVSEKSLAKQRRRTLIFQVQRFTVYCRLLEQQVQEFVESESSLSHTAIDEIEEVVSSPLEDDACCAESYMRAMVQPRRKSRSHHTHLSISDLDGIAVPTS